jgi:hypothetical protein
MTDRTDDADALLAISAKLSEATRDAQALHPKTRNPRVESVLEDLIAQIDNRLQDLNGERDLIEAGDGYLASGEAEAAEVVIKGEEAD